jgi:hypothetical protein
MRLSGFPVHFKKLKVGMVVRAGGVDVGGTLIACLPGLDGAASGCTKSHVADRVYGGGREGAI